jgi:hypothetical protein
LDAVQANNALKLGSFIIFNPDPENGVIGPNITFSGANIHIVSGGQTTANPMGLGNLIIGYDEVPNDFVQGERSGSHNLVIGFCNRFSREASGGIVAGSHNKIDGTSAWVWGGNLNTATGFTCSIT